MKGSIKQMKKIGVFICNFNGRDWVIKCINSLLQQTEKDYDVYVVDNASTDGTVEAVKNTFGDGVCCLSNPENLGGAGGFDRGLKYGLEQDYEYIVLLDNDIVLEEHCLENMKAYLDQHLDVGIVGSKVMVMDNPNMIQDYGNYLDFNIYREKNGYAWKEDSDELPEVNECDYVPSCAIMIRSSMLRVSGTMPADNFIYYDDIELSHKMRLHNWKVVALSDVKVWHKGGFNKGVKNTFARYYFCRNRFNFFAKYVEENKIDDFIDVILREVYSQLYGFHNKGMSEMFTTTMYAFDDFLHQVRGKADTYKIMDIVEKKTPFQSLLMDKSNIEITMIDNFDERNELEIFHILHYIVESIQKINEQKIIWVSLKNTNYSREQFEENWNKVLPTNSIGYTLPEIRLSEDGLQYDLQLQICKHVRAVEEVKLPIVYVDRYCNCIASEKEFKHLTGYFANEDMFLEMYRPLMKQAVLSIRKEK